MSSSGRNSTVVDGNSPTAITEKEEELQSNGAPLKVDKRGFPLAPQPTAFKDDPLVSPSSRFHHNAVR